MNPLFTGKIKKAATTAPKFVPRLPLCLLKQLFFAYIAPVLYELRGLYVCINTAEQPLRIALDQLIVIADLCRQRMEHGILSAGHSGIGCRPFQQERLFLWKCNFLYHSCRDNLPLSDDILPYDRAGVKEYTAQR